MFDECLPHVILFLVLSSTYRDAEDHVCELTDPIDATAKSLQLV